MHKLKKCAKTSHGIVFLFISNMSYINYIKPPLTPAPWIMALGSTPLQIELAEVSRCALYCILQAALREQPPVVMLVGNKTDQHSKREVTSEDGRQLALVCIYSCHAIPCFILYCHGYFRSCRLCSRKWVHCLEIMYYKRTPPSHSFF